MPDKPTYEELELRIRELEKAESECRKAKDLLKLERKMYIEVLKYQPTGIYRIRVFSSKRFPKYAWRDSDKPPYILELVNERFCEILDINREIFETNPGIVVDLVYPEDKAEFIRKNEEANANVKPFLWDGRMSLRGKIYWVHFESLPRLVANGDILWTGILYDITDKKNFEMEKDKLIGKLQKAANEIKTLQGILPICSFCKNIRNDEGYYEQIESYIHKHSGVDFSHTICPSCMQEHYPEEYNDIVLNKKS